MTIAKKSFGQHFLKDTSVVQSIIDAARPEDFALTVEIGPGTGVVTDAIVKSEKEKVKSGESKLVLIEADRDLIPNLTNKFPDATIIRADAAQVDYAAQLFTLDPSTSLGTPFGRFSLSTPWLLIGNLPYNAANAIIMYALESATPPSRMVVMVQKEVGERLLGLPGCRGLLTVAVQLYADVTRVCNVKPGAFNPPPKVDSMVVCITPHISPSPHLSVSSIIRIAKAGFANRRKQLHGNLAAVGIATSQQVKDVLVSLGLSPTARAEELSVEQWKEFCMQIK